MEHSCCTPHAWYHSLSLGCRNPPCATGLAECQRSPGSQHNSLPLVLSQRCGNLHQCACCDQSFSHRCSRFVDGCQERKGDMAVAAVGPVEAGPGRDTPTAKRHALTPRPMAAAEGFRVITYNLLADQYASSETGQTKLFSYCATRCSQSHH